MPEHGSYHLSSRENVKRYIDRMDAALRMKWRVLEPYLEELKRRPQPIVVSIGAGSGKLERALVEQAELNVLALDLSLPMLETIQGQAAEIEDHWQEIHPRLNPNQIKHPHLWVANADATQLPLASNSVDAILCFSVNHEVASFANNYDFSKLTEYFAQIAQALKPGGLYLIRDFMQPDNPDRMVSVRIGEGQGNEESPLLFTTRFAKDFPGDQNLNMRAQIVAHQSGHNWQPGAVLNMTQAQALELIAHYSWHSSPEEISERYAYLPASQYAEFVIAAAASAGIEFELCKQITTAQPGYDLHTAGRLDLIDQHGTRQSLPPWTGELVFRRKA